MFRFSNSPRLIRPVIQPESQIAESIGGVTGPIMHGPVLVNFAVLVILAPIHAQRLKPAPGLCLVKMAARQNSAHSVDAVSQILRGYHTSAAQPKGLQYLQPALARTQFPHPRVMGQQVLGVDIRLAHQPFGVMLHPMKRTTIICDGPDCEKSATGTGYQAGFRSRLEALQWEKDTQNQTSSFTPSASALYEIIALYLLEVEQRRKKNTFIYKNSVLKKFVTFAGKDTLFADIDRQHIKQFLSKASKEISPKSANKYRIELSALWTWANVEGHVTGNPARKIEPFPVKRHTRYVPPKEHITKALEHADKFEKDFILALLHTAGRISEIRELTWEDVDLDRGIIRLWTSKRRGGNRESRTIALSDTLKDIFSRLNEERTGGEVYVFTNPRTGSGYTRQSREVKYLFQRVCEKAEIPLFTAHCLRHFVATYFNDPRRAQKILGHENLKTTEIYLHDLGVDAGAATIFESITHEITHKKDSGTKKGSTVLQ